MKRFEGFFSILFWIVLGAAILWMYQAATTRQGEKSDLVKSKTASRRATVTKAMLDGPKTTIWATPNGDVIELLFPSSSVGGQIVEVKRCIVFRDTFTKSSSMSCDQEGRPAGTDDFDPRDMVQE